MVEIISKFIEQLRFFLWTLNLTDYGSWTSSLVKALFWWTEQIGSVRISQNFTEDFLHVRGTFRRRLSEHLEETDEIEDNQALVSLHSSSDKLYNGRNLIFENNFTSVYCYGLYKNKLK